MVAGLAALAAGSALVAQAPQAPSAATHYPATARGTQADDLSGIRVADPYRWLEAVNSPGVQAWVASQNAFTQAYLAELPQRKSVQDQVTRSWTYPKIGAPFAAGERLFFYENSGVENQSVLYVQERH